MAASSHLLRSLVLASYHRALYTPGSSRYPTCFLQLRSETLNLRGSDLRCRSFSSQALEVTDPVLENRSSKKKKPAASSWEEAGSAFFAKKAKNAPESENSVEQSDECKGVSAPARMQSRRSQQYSEQEPVVNRNFGRKNDGGTYAFSGHNIGDSRNASRDFDRGKGVFTGRNGGFARRESVDMDNRNFDRGRGESTGRNGSFARRGSADMDNRNFDRGRGGFTGRYESADMDTGRGANRGRGFREEFSDVGDDNRGNRWNGRRGADDRNRWNARNDTSRGLRDGYADEKASSRSEGAFRKEFGESVDTSKSFFRNRNQGGTLGKKQFPDMDGGKRMFKGRYEGDGFAKKHICGNEGGDDGNRRKKAYGMMKGRQSFSKESSLTRAQKQSEDDLEAESSCEDDEDDIEDFPQAGDVIRYSEVAGATRERNRRQSSLGAEDSERELQEEDEAQLKLDDDEDVDDNAHKRDKFGSKRRELPMMSSSLPKIIGEVVYGVGPVYAALQVSRREFFCLYVQQNMPIGGGNASKKKDKKAMELIIRTAIDRGLEIKEVSKHDLNMLADNRPHQGLILDASPLELVVSTHLEAPLGENGKTPVWVALDEVTDPQNFGAILRSAYFMGAKGVVVCAKNSAPLSAVVSKASAGALEIIELRSCKNMMKFLDRSTENGWRVIGGSAAGTDVISVRELPHGLPTILVLGGEGKGLRTNVKRSCSELVCIPGFASESQGQRGTLPNKFQDADMDAEDNEHRPILRGAREDFIAVDSLNVSVAAGILLHELLNNQAALKSSSDEHSEMNAEEVLADEQVHLSESADMVLSDEQEQQSKRGAEAMLGDEQEQPSKSDVEAVLGDGLEQHSKSDVEAVLGDKQEQHSGGGEEAALTNEQVQHHDIDVKAVLIDELEQVSQITATD